MLQFPKHFEEERMAEKQMQALLFWVGSELFPVRCPQHWSSAGPLREAARTWQVYIYLSSGMPPLLPATTTSWQLPVHIAALIPL